MRTIEYNTPSDIEPVLHKEAFPFEIIQKVSEIIKRVREEKDKALIEFTEMFDHFKPDRIEVPSRELERAWDELDEADKETLKIAKERVERYHSYQLEKSWFFTEGSATFGMIVRPLERVGVYVPGGRFPLVSTVIMNVVPAKVAGVEKIFLATPAPRGNVNKYILAAAYLCGVEKVFLIGGAQAIAAFAFGTESVPKVDKIVGPGNVYVAEAKRQVYGVVDIDSIAGPSEILVIADDSANPYYVAADLLSQAEHDTFARPILVTDSKAFAETVIEKLYEMLKSLPTKEIARESIEANGFVVIVDTVEKAVEVANLIAPEHLEVIVKNPMKLLGKIKNAGAVFLGNFSPEPMGDYIAGPNHTLPTGGRARFSSPLGVYDFVKRMSFINLDERLFRSIAPYACRLAEIEGLYAHKKSITIRYQEGEG